MFVELISGVLQGWLWTPLRTGLIFWLGGFILWLLHIINWQAVSQLLHNHLANDERFIRQEWLGVGDFLRHLPKPEALLALLVLVSIILLSGIVVKASQFGLLRLLEGYGWPSGLRTWRVNHYEKQYQTQFARWEILANKGTSRTPAENWEYASLDKEMVIYSHDMPTRLGNILRGYEQRPREKYGLDMIVCWPRLWLLLPQSTQEELSTARAALDEAIQVIAWGALFLIWMVWGEWLAVLMALLLIWGGYRLALQSVEVYGQLLDATFDVHRHLLYQALHWQFPENPAEERQRGEEMTQYLWRGANS